MYYGFRKLMKERAKEHAKIVVNNHIEKWERLHLPPEKQLRRIKFILKNKNEHPELLSEPMVEVLEEVASQLEKKILNKKIETAMNNPQVSQMVQVINAHHEKSKFWFNVACTGALGIGLSWMIPEPTSSFIVKAAGFMLTGLGVVLSIYHHLKINRLGPLSEYYDLFRITTNIGMPTMIAMTGLQFGNAMHILSGGKFGMKFAFNDNQLSFTDVLFQEPPDLPGDIVLKSFFAGIFTIGFYYAYKIADEEITKSAKVSVALKNNK